MVLIMDKTQNSIHSDHMKFSLFAELKQIYICNIWL